MRTTDRQHVSEAVRRSADWQLITVGLRDHEIVLKDYSKTLDISYGPKGRITSAVLYRRTPDGRDFDTVVLNGRTRVLVEISS